MSEAVRCDICNAEVSHFEGFQLTTTQVVGSSHFWQRYFQLHQAEFEQAGISSYAELCASPLRMGVAAQVASSATPWLVCGTCIRLFEVDRGMAAAHARRWWDSGGKYHLPGSGAAPLSSVRMEIVTGEPLPPQSEAPFQPAETPLQVPEVQSAPPPALIETAPSVSAFEPLVPTPPQVAEPAPQAPDVQPAPPPAFTETVPSVSTVEPPAPAPPQEAEAEPSVHLVELSALGEAIPSVAQAELAAPSSPPAAETIQPPPRAERLDIPRIVPAVRESRPPKGKARWPLATGLLDLSGLGLGQFYTGRPLAGVIYLLVTAGLLTLAFFTQATIVPVFWIFLLGLWLLIAAVSGGRVAHRLERATGKARRSWLPLIVAVLLLGLEAAGVAGYLALGQGEFKAGEAAYHSADCSTAMQHYNQVARLYELTLSLNVATADARLSECSLLVHAQNLWKQAQYAQAIVGYEAYLAIFPQSELTSYVQESVSQVYGEWAGEQQKAGDYAAAVDTYQQVAQAFPQTTLGKQAPDLAADVLAQWAGELFESADYPAAMNTFERILEEFPTTPDGQKVAVQAAGVLDAWAAQELADEDYAGALEKYKMILETYPETPSGQGAAVAAAQACAAWAEQSLASGDYAGAIEHYLTALSRYPDTPVGREAAARITEVYDQWAVDLAGQGEYSAAIEKYVIVQGYYPDTPNGKQAGERIAGMYADWAAALRKEGDYALALEKYHTLLNYYARTQAGGLAGAAAATTYLEWAEALSGKGSYQEAISKYQSLLSEFPAASSAKEAEAAIPSTYVTWGSALQSQKKFTEALSKFNLVLQDYPDSTVYTSTVLMVGQAYNAWGENLRSLRSFIQALEKFTLAKEATDDPEVIAAAEEGYAAALLDLSQDSTGDGLKVIQDTLGLVCAGEAAVSPAVGLAKDEVGKARMCDTGLTLPTELLATQPGHFRYVILTTSGSTEIQRCPYTYSWCSGWWCPTTNTLVRQQQWMQVEVRNTLTGYTLYTQKFTGSYPDTCPSTWSFIGTEDYLRGSAPSTDEIIDWLSRVLK